MTGLVSAALLVLSLTTGLLPSPPPAQPAMPHARSVPGAQPGADAVWPLAPRPAVVTPFSPPVLRWEVGHRGVDLAGDPGQSVRAALPGTVTFAGMLAGRGVVVVNHGDRRTTYEPVAASVRVGDAVGPGTPIGTLQAGQGHCPPQFCLHWGLIAGTDYLDPLGLLQLGPVRLLPLLPGLLTLADAPGETRSAAVRW